MSVKSHGNGHFVYTFQLRTEERENYKNHLQQLEKELATSKQALKDADAKRKSAA